MQHWTIEWAGISGFAAFCCAIFLTFAMFMPNWIARTSWSRANRRNDFMSVVDSPASYVGLVSLWGLIALVALIVAVWRRSVFTGVLAAVAFACAAYVLGNFWLGLSRGVILLDGTPTPEMGPPRWEVHWPPMLPFFVAAAIVGVVSALVLAIASWQEPKGA